VVGELPDGVVVEVIGLSDVVVLRVVDVSDDEVVIEEVVVEIVSDGVVVVSDVDVVVLMMVDGSDDEVGEVKVEEVSSSLTTTRKTAVCDRTPQTVPEHCRLETRSVQLPLNRGLLFPFPYYLINTYYLVPIT
jgi:hypothetical protein